MVWGVKRGLGKDAKFLGAPQTFRTLSEVLLPQTARLSRCRLLLFYE